MKCRRCGAPTTETYGDKAKIPMCDSCVVKIVLEYSIRRSEVKELTES